MVKQPATARFLSRHLYNFFVADEPQVPSWNITEPNDPGAIDALIATYNETDGDIARCCVCSSTPTFSRQPGTRG